MPYYVCSQSGTTLNNTNIDNIMDEYLELKLDELITYETYDELTGDEYADAVLSTLAWLSPQPVQYYVHGWATNQFTSFIHSNYVYCF